MHYAITNYAMHDAVCMLYVEILRSVPLFCLLLTPLVHLFCFILFLYLFVHSQVVEPARSKVLYRIVSFYHISKV